MNKTSHSLVLMSTLLFCAAAIAGEQPTVEHRAAAIKLSVAPQHQVSVDLSNVSGQLVADLQQQLSSSIRVEVRSALASLAESVKQVVGQ